MPPSTILTEPALPLPRGSDHARACARVLTDEGFHVGPWLGRRGRASGTVDLLARRGDRVVHAIVIPPDRVDSPRTRASIRRSAEEGETRVFVPWRLKWRMASNLERWGIPGVALSDY